MGSSQGSLEKEDPPAGVLSRPLSPKLYQGQASGFALWLVDGSPSSGFVSPEGTRGWLRPAAGPSSAFPLNVWGGLEERTPTVSAPVNVETDIRADLEALQWRLYPHPQIGCRVVLQVAAGRFLAPLCIPFLICQQVPPAGPGAEGWLDPWLGNGSQGVVIPMLALWGKPLDPIQHLEGRRAPRICPRSGHKWFEQEDQWL